MSKSEEQPQRVLLVEDDRLLARSLAEAIGEKGLHVDVTADATEAIRMLQENKYNVLVVDLILPVGSGFEIIRSIKERGDHASLAVIVITGAEASALVDLDRTVVNTLLFKPLDFSQLAAYVHISSLRH